MIQQASCYNGHSTNYLGLRRSCAVFAWNWMRFWSRLGPNPYSSSNLRTWRECSPKNDLHLCGYQGNSSSVSTSCDGAISNPNAGLSVRLPDGQDMCLHRLMLYNCQSIIQHDQAVYGDKSYRFIPQRWLDTGSTIPASAWQPFKRGPCNCIGQELANIEALVILACAAQRYDWEKVGLGSIKRDESGAPIEKENGQYEVQSELYNVRVPPLYRYAFTNKV
jgi:Cytochrome P450